MELVSSVQNKVYKHLKKLIDKSSYRKEEALFVVEGLREINIAIKSGFLPEMLIDCPEIPYQSDEGFLPNPALKNIINFDKKLIQSLSYRENSDGCLGVFKLKNFDFNDAFLNENTLILAVEGSEKPGNIGAILRTADAVGASAVVLLEHQTDVFSPNIIRSSVGCVFSKPIIKATNSDFLNWCNQLGIEIVLTTPHTDVLYTSYIFKQKNAVLFGSEADGLSSFWMDSAFDKIKFPMHGTIDSLNLSNSVAIAAYEWRKNYPL